ncbi:hypothetical protein [Aphanothece sacrum]|uniref:Uncharacterized protein n=1 Tax=Aphanothece sacrum FPU1 TaxID=1920663 RepID=A0A401ID77_APHSA|nr:hypothetical protein [Aphanothece sacrum]GBF79202.1 hypothetical protein AsFPU1_0594 [Aphanothece sacrum FPU1]GBF86592.1 hypothetical protein AsFPU3_3663 [Aphanothece sacrum FPU3]
MTISVYCLDNDIILKLATYSLFDKTLKTFEIDSSKVKILETFKYKFRRDHQRKRSNNPVTYNLEAALNVTESCGEISEKDVNQEIFIKLQKTKGIDVGEALLISYISDFNQQKDLGYLLTGDKRCLKTLINPEIADIVKTLEGKVWCLEQLVLKDIEIYGFNYIKDKIYPVRDCDTNIKHIFGYSVEASEDRVIEDLKKSIITLRKETGNLLYPYPK